MKIDIVFTYVDGNDEKWLKQKNKDHNNYYKSKKYTNKYNNKYNSNIDEIKYSIKSIEKYFKDYYNNIYFVTNNGKLPKCIKKKKNYYSILDSDLTGHRTYNSCSIEPYLHKIKGLSEYYLYFNDDMLLNKNTKLSDFINESGKLIWYEESNFFIKTANYFPIITKLYDFGDAGCNDSRIKLYKLLKLNNNPNPIAHCPRIFKKSLVYDFHKVFDKQLNEQKKRLFRSKNDFPFCDAFCFYYLNKNKIIYSNKYKTNILVQFDSNTISKLYNYIDKDSKFICIEDMRKNIFIDTHIKYLLDNELFSDNKHYNNNYIKIVILIVIFIFIILFYMSNYLKLLK